MILGEFQSFESIFDKDLMSIWNGKNYQDLRKKLINDDFSLCNRTKCHYRPSNYDSSFNAAKQYPQIVVLSYDQECNYRCITCRDDIITNDDKQLAFLDNTVKPRLMPFLLNANEVLFSGGDPLVSRHTRKLIKDFLKLKPDAKISVHTQGYFLDKQNFAELGITQLYGASVSINAATRKTYEKIMRIDATKDIAEVTLSVWKQLDKKGIR